MQYTGGFTQIVPVIFSHSEPFSFGFDGGLGGASGFASVEGFLTEGDVDTVLDSFVSDFVFL